MSSAPVLAGDLAAALATVVDPCSVATGVPLNIVEMGLVRRAERFADRVEVDLRLTAPVCLYAAPMMEAVEQAVKHGCGVSTVVCTADHGLEWMPSDISVDARTRLQLLRPVPQRAEIGADPAPLD